MSARRSSSEKAGKGNLEVTQLKLKIQEMVDQLKSSVPKQEYDKVKQDLEKSKVDCQRKVSRLEGELEKSKAISDKIEEIILATQRLNQSASSALDKIEHTIQRVNAFGSRLTDFEKEVSARFQSTENSFQALMGGISFIKGKLDEYVKVEEANREAEALRTEVAGLHTRLQHSETMVSELEVKVVGMVPKEEFEKVNAHIEAQKKEMDELQSRLAASIPKAEADAQIADLEGRLATAIQESEAIRAKISELVANLSLSMVKNTSTMHAEGEPTPQMMTEVEGPAPPMEESGTITPSLGVAVGEAPVINPEAVTVQPETRDGQGDSSTPQSS